MTTETATMLTGDPEYVSQEPLAGEDGNAFAIIGRVQKGLRRAGAPPEYVDAVGKAMMAGDYDHLLQVALHFTDPEAV